MYYSKFCFKIVFSVRSTAFATRAAREEESSSSDEALVPKKKKPRILDNDDDDELAPTLPLISHSGPSAEVIHVPASSPSTGQSQGGTRRDSRDRLLLQLGAATQAYD